MVWKIWAARKTADITLIVTASGVFGEMQTALNAIWKAEPKGLAANSRALSV
jgi:uncharacterized BrkB/YihY/UPF0761 family membrane protein